MKKVKKILDKILNRKFKSITALFLSYSDIKLKLYLEIAYTLDYKKLIISGQATDKECHQAWEKIIAQNYKTNGGLDFINYIDQIESYNNLLADYNIVKAYLLKLWFVVDDKMIGALIDKGYKIVTKQEDNGYDPSISLSENYKQSLINALTRAENLVTKMKMKANEIASFFKGETGGSRALTFDELMANLLARGLKIDDDITLARYVELVKVLTKSNEEQNVYG